MNQTNPNQDPDYAAALVSVFTLSTLIMIVLLIASFFISSCTSVRYVPVETVKTDSVYLTRTHTDSIYIRDSVSTVTRGDTIRIDRLRYVYRYLTHTDTAYIERTDSIRVPYPVEIPARLTPWQHVKQTLGGYALILMSMVIVGWLVYRRRLRK